MDRLPLARLASHTVPRYAPTVPLAFISMQTPALVTPTPAVVPTAKLPLVRAVLYMATPFVLLATRATIPVERPAWPIRAAVLAVYLRWV